MIKRIIISNFKGIKSADVIFHQGKNILVGNNGVGKSTMLEALSLALGIGLNQLEITQHLFHISAINEFESTKKLPEIIIELYFDAKSEYSANITEYSGKNHSLSTTEELGIRLHISCDEEYKRIFESSPDDYKHIPCEYYHIERKWFSDEVVKQFLVPYTTCSIDSSNSSFNYRANHLTTRIIEEELTEKESIEMKGCLRQLKEKFEEDEKMTRVNDSLNSKIEDTAKGLKLSVDLTSRSAWNTILAPVYNDIPFSQIGLGEQCIIKTMLSATRKIEGKKKIMIIEEPESHLSHTKMYELMSKLCEFQGQLFITTHNSFVANKLDLENLIVLDNIEGEIKSSKFDTKENKDRLKYFTKAPNFPTLRIILCQKAILVEGPTDEMILLYYFQKKYQKHPFDMGIELIVIGGNKMFPRFTELAESIGKKVAIITDNDKDDEETVKNRVNPKKYSCVEVFTDKDSQLHTIEPSFVAANIEKLQKLSDLLRGNKVPNDTADGLSSYLESNKVEWSYKIITSGNYDYNVPKYIIDAVDWITK